MPSAVAAIPDRPTSLIVFRATVIPGVATLVSLVIGVTYGATSGYVGGWVDNLLMRIVDVLYSVPFIFLVIFLITILNENTVPIQQLGNKTLKVWLLDHGIDRIKVFASYQMVDLRDEVDAILLAGTITQILGENGQAVEYGQPLFVIE